MRVCKTRIMGVCFVVRFIAPLALFFLSTLLCFSVGEVVFRYVYISSSGWDFTLANKKWFQRYWKPLTSEGYRDVERPKESLVGKRSLFVLGDSFTAGHGIKDVNDRFTEVLQQKLPKNWVVFNIARNGWGTEQQFDALRSHRVSPDAVVLAYFPNDIERAAKRLGLRRPGNRLPQPTGVISPLVHHSYLVNFLYWRIVSMSSGYYGEQYWQYLKKCFADERVLVEHAKELTVLAEYLTQRNISLVILFLPHAHDMTGSEQMLQSLKGAIARLNVPVINAAEPLAPLSPQDIVVNMLNAHYNERTNHLIGEYLFHQLVKQQLVPATSNAPLN